MEKSVNWNDYPNFFKRGSYIQRKKVVRAFTTQELSCLPEKHEARSNSNLVIERTEYGVLDLPPLSKIKNRERVIYFGEAPELYEVIS